VCARVARSDCTGTGADMVRATRGRHRNGPPGECERERERVSERERMSKSQRGTGRRCRRRRRRRGRRSNGNRTCTPIIVINTKDFYVKSSLKFSTNFFQPKIECKPQYLEQSFLIFSRFNLSDKKLPTCTVETF